MNRLIIALALLLCSCNLPCALRRHSQTAYSPQQMYAERHFSHGTKAYRYYTAGEGPPVIVLHELPGATPEFVRFTDLLVARGYKVYAPLFFGDKFGRRLSRWQIVRVNRSAEFRASAPVPDQALVQWLRAFTAHVRNENGGGKIGVIGMCLTGSLPLFVTTTPGAVSAVVLSQPSLPFSLKRRNTAAINVDVPTLAAARRSGVPILAMRFTDDCISTSNRFKTLRSTFPPSQMEAIEIPSGKHGVSNHAHAILTQEYKAGGMTAAAAECVMSFLDHRVKGKSVKLVQWPDGSRYRCGRRSTKDEKFHER